MTRDHKNDSRRSTPSEVMDAAIELAIEDELEREEVTAADLHVAFDAVSSMRPALAELRRRLIPTTPVVRRAAPISAELGSLGRVELLARIDQVRHQGDVRYAFQELKGLSDDDLRQMLAIMLESSEG